MFRRRLVLVTLIALAFWTCDLQAAQIASTWVGGSQGEWGNARQWGDPCNWDPAIVPDNNATNTFAVTIDVGGDQVQVHLQRSRTIDRLDCYGEVWMYMGVSHIGGDAMPIDVTLNEPNGLSNYGDFRLHIYAAHWSRIVGNITNHGVMELRGNIGYLKGNVTNLSGAELCLMNLWVTGDLHNVAGGVIELERVVDVGGAVENAGSIIVIPASELVIDNTFHNTGQIEIYNGLCEAETLFHNDNAGSITGFGVLSGENSFDNDGTIFAYGGSLVISSEGSLTNTGILGSKSMSSLHIKPGGDVNNQGTIEVNTGGGVVFDCNLVNETNGAIELRGGTLAATTITQTANANFVGFGSITGNAVLEPNASIELTGLTNIVGDVEIGPEATLEISDGTTLITGHTTCNGTIHIKGGRIIPQGGLSGACNIIWEPGTYSNIADFNLDGQVNFEDFAYFADTWLWQAD